MRVNPIPEAAVVQSADEKSVELSSRRTGMSFQRTRLSAERTLMSVIRTSLSLIGFGFTIFQFFQKLHDAGALKADRAPRNFGTALLALGVGILILGIVYHLAFMYSLRRERKMLTDSHLIHGESGYPASYTLLVAMLVLILGLVAGASMTFNIGPFS